MSLRPPSFLNFLRFGASVDCCEHWHDLSQAGSHWLKLTERLRSQGSVGVRWRKNERKSESEKRKQEQGLTQGVHRTLCGLDSFGLGHKRSNGGLLRLARCTSAARCAVGCLLLKVPLHRRRVCRVSSVVASCNDLTKQPDLANVSAGDSDDSDDDYKPLVQARVDYKGQSPAQLSFSKGDQIRVLGPVEGGWFKGWAFGLFPHCLFLCPFRVWARRRA
jgi:hypothetical protein